MKTELSISCNVITDYEEAKKEQGNSTVWTIVEKDDIQYIEQKLVKKNGVGFIIIPRIIKEIILYRREKWTANIKVD